MMALVSLGRVEEVPEGEARRFEVGEQAIAVANLGGGAFLAVDDVCSHAYAELHEGELDVEERTIECPKHGSLFSLDDGRPLSLPATAPVQTYVIKVEDDEIKVEL